MLPEVFVSSRRAIVLIVDDESLSLKLLKRPVIPHGHAVWEAQHGSEAICKAQDKLDLILLVVMTPSLEGFEACRRLKENELSRGFLVILLTMAGQLQCRLRGLEHGIVECHGCHERRERAHQCRGRIDQGEVEGRTMEA
jgi:DNA-binding response OmpR family regulator